MSELVQRKVVNFLGEDDDLRQSRLLAAGPQAIAEELLKNWLPEGWNIEAEYEGMFDVARYPDTQEAAEDAEVEARQLEAAGIVWQRLPSAQREMVLDAAELLSPGVRGDLRHTLDQCMPSDGILGFL